MVSLFFANNKKLSAVWIPTYSGGGYLDELCCGKTWLGMHKLAPGHSASFFVDKEIHSDLGLYNTDTKYCADHELYWKIIRSKKAVAILKIKTDFGVFTHGGFSSTNPYHLKLREEVRFRSSGLFKNQSDTFFILLIWPLKEIWRILKAFVKEMMVLFRKITG